MRNKTNIILKTMNVIFWIVFIGLCIRTGALLTSFFVSLFIDPAASVNLYVGLNLYKLHEYSISHYIAMVSSIILLWGLQAYIAFLVVRISLKFSLVHPFSMEVAKLIMKISYMALGTGVLAIFTKAYAIELTTQVSLTLNLLHYLNWGVEFLFLAGIIFIIAQVFKKGIELQSENELTV